MMNHHFSLSCAVISGIYRWEIALAHAGHELTVYFTTSKMGGKTIILLVLSKMEIWDRLQQNVYTCTSMPLQILMKKGEALDSSWFPSGVTNQVVAWKYR